MDNFQSLQTSASVNFFGYKWLSSQGLEQDEFASQIQAFQHHYHLPSKVTLSLLYFLATIKDSLHSNVWKILSIPQA